MKVRTNRRLSKIFLWSILYWECPIIGWSVKQRSNGNANDSSCIWIVQFKRCTYASHKWLSIKWLQFSAQSSYGNQVFFSFLCVYAFFLIAALSWRLLTFQRPHICSCFNNYFMCSLGFLHMKIIIAFDMCLCVYSIHICMLFFFRVFSFHIWALAA